MNQEEVCEKHFLRCFVVREWTLKISENSLAYEPLFSLRNNEEMNEKKKTFDHFSNFLGHILKIPKIGF